MIDIEDWDEDSLDNYEDEEDLPDLDFDNNIYAEEEGNDED